VRICIPFRLNTGVSQTDRQTDGRTDILPWHSPRYAYASRDKNRSNVRPCVVRCQALRRWADVDGTWHIHSVGRLTKLLGSGVLNFGSCACGRDDPPPKPGCFLSYNLRTAGNYGDDELSCGVAQVSQLKIFDIATGRETASFPTSSTRPDSSRPSSPFSSSRRPSDVDDRPLLEPHGVCADDHGLVFVADRRAHAVRVFDERCGVRGGPRTTAGRSLASYDDERHSVGLPFAVACNKRGQLAVADYVGTVRVFSYFAEADSDC